MISPLQEALILFVDNSIEISNISFTLRELIETYNIMTQIKKE